MPEESLATGCEKIFHNDNETFSRGATESRGRRYAGLHIVLFRRAGSSRPTKASPLKGGGAKRRRDLR